MLKRIVSLLITVVVLALSCTMFTGCAAPKVEEIYDRVVYLVEASHEVNTVFYGPGMPVYHADSEYAERKHIYFGFSQSDYYEHVTEHSKFFSENQVMERARKIYCKEFLEDVLSVSAFTGFASDSGTGHVIIERARYLEESNWIYQSSDPSDTLYTAMRIYDYSTMEVHSLGRKNACTVTMDSWLENTPDKIENVEIYLVLQDGEWFLNSFTGA